MEKILHQILINIYDWRMWVVLICIPLLFVGSIYSCIQKRHDWRRKEIVLNMVPIWVFLLGGGLVFAHVLDLVDFCANVIGGILMGVGSVINGMFAVMEMKKVENVRKRMKYEAWVSFIAGVMILIQILMFFIPG